jgi:hypothetical protein
MQNYLDEQKTTTSADTVALKAKYRWSLAACSALQTHLAPEVLVSARKLAA